MLHITTFREPAETARYQAALGLVAAAAECGGGDEGLNRLIKLIVRMARARFRDGRLRASGTNGRSATVVDLSPRQPTARGTRSAQTADTQTSARWRTHRARRASVERKSNKISFSRFFRYEMFVGLPLRDERRNTLGAILLGRRAPLPADAFVIEPLRMIAGRLVSGTGIAPRARAGTRERSAGRVDGFAEPLVVQRSA